MTTNNALQFRLNLQKVNHKNDGSLTAIATNVSGRLIVGGDTTGAIAVWDGYTGGLLKTLQTPNKGWITAIAITPDNEKIITGDHGGKINVMDFFTGEVIKTFHDLGDGITDLLLTPDGKLISANYSGIVKTWDLITYKLIKALEAPSAVTSLALIDGGVRLAGGLNSGGLHFWDLASRGAIESEDTDTEGVYTIASNSNGLLVVSAGVSGIIKTWWSTGEIISEINAHEGRVNSLIILGNKIISAGQDGKIKTWDLTTGKCEGILDTHKSNVYALATPQGGDYIVSGGWREEVKIWGRNGAAN